MKVKSRPSRKLSSAPASMKSFGSMVRSMGPKMVASMKGTGRRTLKRK